MVRSRPPIIPDNPLIIGSANRPEAKTRFSDHSSRRRRLIDLALLWHCSIIGTCLTTTELRKVVNKIVGDRGQNISDHQIHTEGVRFASEPGLPTKLLNKALDERHAATIRRFAVAKSESELRELWNSSKREGAVEGAYWAIATHPAASEKFSFEVFGYIHMLSHLVGSTNRADIKRLSQMESDNSELRDKFDKLTVAIRSGFSTRDQEIQRLRGLLADKLFAEQSSASRSDMELGDEISAYRTTIADLKRQLSNEAARAERFRLERNHLNQDLETSSKKITTAQILIDELAGELNELEEHVSGSSGDDTDAILHLAGKTVLYVGGKAKSIQHLRPVVTSAGAIFLHHDGGQEQSARLLPGLISKSDIVIFPVDFISHGGAATVKRYCTQLGKPFLPVPRSGVAGLLVALKALRR